MTKNQPHRTKRSVTVESSGPVSQAASSTHLPFRYALLHAATFATPVFAIILYTVPKPYLDEIFHIPLAQYYCSTQDFSKWDPMITTPPGLYWLATAYGHLIVAPLLALLKAPVKAMLQLQGIPSPIRFGLESIANMSECGVGSLRSTNLVALVLVFPCTLFLFFKAQAKLQAGPKPFKVPGFKTKRVDTVHKPTHAIESNSSSPKEGSDPSYGTNFNETCRLILSLFQFPLMFFFAMLFYTDVWSTVLVVLSLAVGKHAIAVYQSERKDWFMPSKRAEKFVFLSAAIALLSLTFRQTNVIWAAYIGASLLEDLTNTKLNQELVNPVQKGKDPEPKPATAEKHLGTPCVFSYTKSVVSFLASYIKTVFSFDSISLAVIVAYAAVGGCFVAFYIWNGGITLGDKSHHQVSINVGQLVYFLLHMTIFMGPPVAVWAGIKLAAQFRSALESNETLQDEQTDSADNVDTKSDDSVSPITKLVKLPLFKWTIAVSLLFVASCLAFALFLHKWAFPSPLHPHPFLLADNRHYTFYIWRRIIDPARHSFVVSLLVSPFFVTGLFVLFGLGPLTQFFASAQRANNRAPGTKKLCNVHIISASFFYLGVLATLVPSPLLEPRYYMVPFILWRLTLATNYSLPDDVLPKKGGGPRAVRNKDAKPSGDFIDDKSKWPLQDFELIWWTLINMVTIYVFIKFPFVWPSELDSLQRFMW